MDIKLKHRLVGACVILALAVFFLPMILDSDKYNQEIKSQIPEGSVLKGQAAVTGSNGDPAESGSLTINLEEDQPEKAIIKPSDKQPNSSVPSSQQGSGDLESKKSESTKNDNGRFAIKSQSDNGEKTTDTSETTAEEDTAIDPGVETTTEQKRSEQPETKEAETMESNKKGVESPESTTDVATNEKVGEGVIEQPDTQQGESGFEQTAWVIQIGSFSNKDNAASLISELRTKGYRAYVREAGEYSRVFVGPYPDKELANSRTEGLQQIVGTPVKILEFDPLSH